MTSVVYDISTISSDPAHRTGLARVTRKTAELLNQRNDMTVWFSSVGSARSLVWAGRVLSAWPGARPALPRDPLAQFMVHCEDQLAKSPRANKAAARLLRYAMSGWNR